MKIDFDEDEVADIVKEYCIRVGIVGSGFSIEPRMIYNGSCSVTIKKSESAVADNG